MVGFYRRLRFRSGNADEYPLDGQIDDLDTNTMSEKLLSVILIKDNPGGVRVEKEPLPDAWDGQDVNLIHAETIEMGLELLTRQAVDAVLLDLTLTGLNGIATLERLNSLVRHVPIILLMGSQDEELATIAMRAGAQDYLVKGELNCKLLMRSIRYAVERKASEEIIRASEERYRTLIEQASDGIFISDRQGQFEDVNSSMCALLGYTRDVLLTKNIHELIVGDFSGSIKNVMQDLQNGKVIIIEYEMVCNDGNSIPVEISAKLLPNGKQQGIVRDIRTRKFAEIALRESNDFNQMLINTLPFLVEIVDENGVILFANSNTASNRIDQILGCRCWEINLKAQDQCTECPLKTDIKIGVTNSLEICGCRDERMYQVTHTGIWYQGRKALLEVFLDITEHKQLEEQLQTSLQQLKFHDENSPLAVIEFDSDYQVRHWSDRAREIFGWTADEVMGKRASDMPWVREDDQRTIEQMVAEMLGTSQTRAFHISQNYRNDGTLITCEWYNSALVDKQGQLVSVQSLVLDITERNQAEQALRESDAFGQAMLSNSPLGIAVRSPDGTLMTANDAWLKIWGFSSTERDQQMQGLKNQVWFDSKTGYLKSVNAEVVKIFSEGGKFYLPELKISRPKPGAAEWVSQQFYSIMDERGNVSKVVILTEDITERKVAELALLKAHVSLEQRVIDRTFELRTANVALEKAARLKDEFLASMSHELRTPLTGILGLSEALQMVTYGELNEKQKKALKSIESSGRHLLSLINDILDLSKIEAGMFELQFSPSSLEGISQASLSMIKGLASQKHQKVNYKMDPPGLILLTDPRRMKQILVNLLGNAVKFTPEGGDLGLEIRGIEETRQVSLTVWDTGIGIREEDVPRLFQPFVQLDSSLSRQYAGTGLGLSLVKRLVEMHGGQVMVDSQFGSGSRFTLLIPWVREETLPMLINRPVTDRIHTSLTIEQNEEQAAHLTSLLRMVGIKNQVSFATGGTVDALNQNKPDVIIIRDSMPGSDLVELMLGLKNDENMKRIPIILITRPETLDRARQSHADGLITEPFTQVELYSELQKIAYKDQTAINLIIKSAKRELPAVVPTVLLAEDNPTIVELISEFLKSQNLQVVSVGSGRDLLEGLEVFEPDILIVDIEMPGMDGLETIRSVRANRFQRVSRLPVIAISAVATSQDRERCLTAGANEYMPKPLQLRELVEMIRRLCTPQK